MLPLALAAIVSALLAPTGRGAIDGRMQHRHAASRMDAGWRPKTVDPLGKAFGVPEGRARPYTLWLDLRTAEVTFAQMVVVKLFYAVRRIVDEAGTSLPSGAAVQGLLFAAERYERADTIGQDLPIYTWSQEGGLLDVRERDPNPLPLHRRSLALASFVQPCCYQRRAVLRISSLAREQVTALNDPQALPAAELRSPASLDALAEAEAELVGLASSADVPVTMAIALPDDPMLWAVALTGLEPPQLACREGNEGA